MSRYWHLKQTKASYEQSLISTDSPTQNVWLVVPLIVNGKNMNMVMAVTWRHLHVTEDQD